jgi:hypothetical protein
MVTGSDVEWLDGTDPAEVSYDSPWRRRWPFGPVWTAVIVVVLVAAAALVGWQINRPAPVRITVAGVRVHDPGAVLAVADREFRAYAGAHRGAVGAGSRCYFERLPSAGPHDVSLTLRCGPVAFFGDPPDGDYLAYPLTSTTPRHGTITLTVNALPLVPTPAAPPQLSALIRPDRRTPVTDHLVAPSPPPAPVDLLVDTGPGAVPGLTSLPSTSVLATFGATVTLLSSGVVTSYGTGDNRRSAPAGHELIAFDLVIDPNDAGVTVFPAPQIDLELSVNGGAGRRLAIPTGATGVIQSVIAVVPLHPKSLDLVLVDHTLTQRMSVLTGTPAPGAITVYQRAVRQVGLDLGTSVFGHLDGRTVQVQLSAFTAGLDYFGVSASDHPPRVDEAYLQTDLCTSVVGVTPINSCAVPQSHDMRLELTASSGTGTGTRTVTAPIVERGDGASVWVVPATYQSGVLVLDRVTLPGGQVVTLDTPFRKPIQIPLQ